MINKDILSDTITRIKNGYLMKAISIKIIKSELFIKILDIFIKEGYINGYKIIDSYIIEIYLKYDTIGNSAIKQLKRISMPGKKIYVSKNELLKINRKNELYIISTSKGIFSSTTAIINNVGGEILLQLL